MVLIEQRAWHQNVQANSLIPDATSWEIRHRIAEALPRLFQLNIARTAQLKENLHFSIALHSLLCASDTLLLSLREGLQSNANFSD